MAGNGYNILINILGNASGLVGAAGQGSAALSSLGNQLKTVASNANQFGKATSGLAIFNNALSKLNTQAQNIGGTGLNVPQIAQLNAQLKSSTALSSQLGNATSGVAIFYNTMARLSGTASSAVATNTTRFRALQPVIGAVSSAMSAMGDRLKPVFQALAGTDAFKAFNSKLVSVRDGVKTTVVSLQNGLSSAASTASGRLKSMFGPIGTALQPVTKGVSSFGTTASSAFQKATSSVKTFVAGLQSAPGSINKITAAINNFRTNTVSGLTAGIKNAIPGIKQTVSGVFDWLQKSLAGGGSGASKTAGIFVNMAQGIESVRAQVMNLNDVFRMTAQAVTSIGRAMTFFVTLPVGAFLSGLVSTSVDFENAMVRVQKVTGLTGDETKILAAELRNVATSSPTTHMELAKIAEVVGQMGVTSVSAIGDLTRIFDIFAVSTDQTGEAVATALSRIGNAFGYTADQMPEKLWRMANVINALENTTSAFATEIQTTLTDFAPFANILKMSEADAAAFSATLVSLGLTASEAGTGLRSLVEYSLKNMDKIADLLEGDKFFNTPTKVKEWMQNDPTALFVRMAAAVSSSNDQLETTTAIMDILEKRGGRAVVLLAQNLAMLQANIRTANNEWVSAGSLMAEYTRAVSSTKSQVGILRNNINDVGITIGDALLPVLNQVVQVAVPAVKMLSDAFKNLSSSQQLQIVMWAGILLAAGPVLMFFGQIVHALSLIIMGFGQSLRVVAFFVGSLGKVSGVAVTVARVFTSWPGLIIAGLAGILKLLSAFGLDVAGLFKGLATKARSWGENLAANLANGLMAGAVRLVTRAISYIANLIAGFFESHSPPKEGPLSTIDQWGLALMETYLNGFKQADFSILSEVGSIIQSWLTRGLEGFDLAGALRGVAQARQTLSNLISKFNSTGIIDEGMLASVTTGLGEIGDNVQSLIRAWLKYNEIQQKIAEIERKRKEVNKAYEAEVQAISKSSMALGDKADAIRLAQRVRDNNLDALDKEEEGLKEQAAVLQAQMEMQKSIIDALDTQADLFQQIADTIKDALEELAKDEEKKKKKKGGKGKGAENMGAGLGGAVDFTDELDGKLKDITSSAWRFVNVFTQGRNDLQGFFDGWNGVQLPPDMAKNMSDMYWKMYQIGEIAGKVRDRFFAVRDSVVSFASDLSSVFKGGQAPEGSSLEGFAKTWETIRGKASAVGATISAVFSSVGSAVGPVFTALQPVFADLGTNLKALGVAFSSMFSTLAPGVPILEVVGKVIGSVLVVAIGLLTGFLGQAVTFMTHFINGLTILITGVITSVSGFTTFLQGAVSLIVGVFTGDGQRVKDAFAQMGDGLKQTAEGIRLTLVGAFEGLFVSIIAGGLAFIESFYNYFVELGNRLGLTVDNTKLNLTQKFAEIWQSVKNALSVNVDDMVQIGKDIIQGLVDGIKSVNLLEVMSGAGSAVSSGFATQLGINSPSTVFFAFGVDLIQGLINGIGSMLGAISSAVAGVGSQILSTISNFLTGGVAGGQQQGGAATTNIDSLIPSQAEVTSRMSVIQTTVTSGMSVITSVITSAGSTIQSAWQSLWTSMATATDSVSGGLRSLRLDVDNVTAAVKRLTQSSEQLRVDKIRQFSDAWATSTSQIQSATNALNNFIRTLTGLNGKTINVQLVATSATASWQASGSQDSSSWKGTGTIRGKQAGGSVFKGTPYVVGEVGPELFLPGESGTILPHKLLDRLVNGDQEPREVVINLSINNPVVREDVDIRRLATQVSQEIAKNMNTKSRFGGVATR